MNEKGKSQLDIEWDQRTLCSDESCIGVIGADGHCKECGRPYEGTLPWMTSGTEGTPEIMADDQDDGMAERSLAQESTAEEAADGEYDSTEDAEVLTEDSDEDSDLEWEKRVLCIDESCIGVIGPDGRCKECGKHFDQSLTEKEPDAPDPPPAETDEATE